MHQKDGQHPLKGPSASSSPPCHAALHRNVRPRGAAQAETQRGRAEKFSKDYKYAHQKLKEERRKRVVWSARLGRTPDRQPPPPARRRSIPAKTRTA